MKKRSKITNKCVFTILIGFVLYSCVESNFCTPSFFKGYKGNKDSMDITFFRISDSMVNKVCGYNHKFNYWRGISKEGKYIPLFSIEGFIHKVNDVIYLTPLGQNQAIKYFDFNMKSKELINLKYKAAGFTGDTISIDKKYYLGLENIFFDKEIKDTIYKFRFSGFKTEKYNDDLVFFVGKNYGVAGIYNSMINDSIEEIISYRGNIYKEILDYKKVIINN